MNFEELKSDWEKEPSGEVNVPARTNTLLNSKQPIEKIRKQLKKDFWGQVIGTLIMGFYPQIFDYVVGAFMKNATTPVIFPKEFYAYYYIQYFIMVIIEMYFIVRFTMFYQYLNYKSVNTLESLYEIYYEIKLKIETWRTWCIALTPYYLVLVVLSWLSFKTAKGLTITVIMNENITVLSAIIVVVFALMFWMTEATIKHNYSKIISQLKGLLDELR